jgi:hypothetical protein
MPSFGASGATPVEPHAAGGIFSSPHLGVVAEAGPEAIIPLSESMRERGLALWQRAGRLLGTPHHAEDGIFDAESKRTPLSEYVRERGTGLRYQISNMFSPVRALDPAFAGMGVNTELLYEGDYHYSEPARQEQELTVPVSISNIIANVSSSFNVEDIAEQVSEQVKRRVKREITRELAQAVENRI